jgi:hypothetical protein
MERMDRDGGDRDIPMEELKEIPQVFVIRDVWQS